MCLRDEEIEAWRLQWPLLKGGGWWLSLWPATQAPQALGRLINTKDLQLGSGTSAEDQTQDLGMKVKGSQELRCL